MTHVDSFLLNLTERFCHRFQLLTGRTNVWLAVQLTNLSIIVYFVWAALYSWNESLVTRLLVMLFCAGLLYALMQTIFRVPIEVYELHAYRRVAKGFRNPRRLQGCASFVSPFSRCCVALSYPILFRLRHAAPQDCASELLPHPLDHHCVGLARVRSAASVSWESVALAAWTPNGRATGRCSK